MRKGRLKGTKVWKFEQGLPVSCKKHGEHMKWGRCGTDAVRCLLCANEKQKAYYKAHPIKYLVSDSKKTARVKNIAFDLTEQYIMELLVQQEDKCALSGVAFDGKKPSLDRIDSDGGYTRDNVQLVIFEVNRMKSDIPQDRFLKLCASIAEYTV